MNIVVPPNQKRKKLQPRTPLSWIKAHVSEIDLGQKFDGQVVHLNTNERILAHFARRQRGEQSFLPHKWNSLKVANHIHGYSTSHFAGASESRKDRTLFLIDVDCKNRGTPEGAAQFLQFITTDECRSKYGLSFPKLFCEGSTNGKGGHGFAVLEKDAMAPDELNKLLLRRLVPWLNHVAKEEQFDIEFVEIKGTMPVIEWGTRKGEVLSFKAGTLAKLPRDCHARFSELQNTTVITSQDLMRLPLISNYPSSSDSSDSKEWTGSCSGRHFDDEALQGLTAGGTFYDVAASLMKGRRISASSRQVVTVEDMAIFLMIGQFFTMNMPTNGAMPTNRWSKMWGALAEAGDIGRAWSPTRFAAIRELLSSLSLLTWEDEKYTIGYWENGKYRKGKAAKWHFSAELMAQLSPEDEVEECDSDNGREEEHPLYQQDLQSWASNLIQLPDDETIRPIERPNLTVYRYNADEIDHLIDDFDRQMAIAA